MMFSEKEIFNILLAALFAVSVLVFMILFFLKAPYGRFTRKNWGLRINPKVAWLVMEAPAFFTIIYCFLIRDNQNSIVTLVFLAIWSIHYFQRTFIYSILIKSGKSTFPVLLILFSILFNVWNGYLNGRYLFHFAPWYEIDWFKDPRFIIGVIIFFMGFAINLHSDHILRQLRKPGENGYKIPTGGFYRYLSSPNYFGEIIEWIGWAILTWSLAGLAFAVFTIANLVPRAIANHNWYTNRFPDYPKARKAIIPFIL
jgi:protein-S-isoprenylcysteine O-methyltransferase Ste14